MVHRQGNQRGWQVGVSIIWWVAGLFIATLVIGVRLLEARERRSSKEIIGLFAALIGHDGFDPLTIYPINILPFRKRKIILRFCQKIVGERDEVQRAALALTLLHVAQFQPGIEKPLSHPATDIINEWMTTHADIKSLLMKKMAASEDDARRKFHEMNTAVTKEQQLLHEMIKIIRSGKMDWLRLLDDHFSDRQTAGGLRVFTRIMDDWLLFALLSGGFAWAAFHQKETELFWITVAVSGAFLWTKLRRVF